MERRNFTISSSFDGLTLHGSLLLPNGTPKAVVQVLHGMCEFREKYFDFAEYFVNNGYAVCIHDHRGHGDSVRAEGDRGYFYERSGEWIVEDSYQVTEYIKKELSGLPVYMFGHSMGSMVARCYLQRHDDAVQKVIVCGSPSKNPLVGAAIALTKCMTLFKGARHRSKMLARLSTGKCNDAFPGEGPGAWVTRDQQYLLPYLENPKYQFTFTCNGFENLFRLMKHTYTKKRYAVKNPDLPILFTSGSDDGVMVSEEKWLASQAALRKAGYRNVGGKLYHGYRHEIHNEIGKEKALADMLAFFEK